MVDRRDVLKGGLVAGAMAGPALAAPVPGDRTYVLVHGAWHNALHWQPVAARLSALGHRSVAVDLPAHGLNARFPDAYITGNGARLAAEVSPVKDVTLEDAAQAVVTTLRAQGDRRCVLVGHSVGGAVITRAAELVPERIDRLVYLAAFAPIGLGSPMAYGALPQARTGYGETLFIGNPGAIGAVRINPRGDAAYLRQLRDAYYNDVAYENFLPYAAMLTPDLPLSFWTTAVTVSPDRWGRIARTYIRCLNDRALAPAIQDRMIADADRVTPHNMFKVETMTTGHSPFASSPAALATILANLP
ncbi:alpha/beta hydrolase [Reyranella sp. CPCC 100927]|uniref:alpha/beta hydrolase n=1 Tax=Reyranella sp. CPCC 100927 TaxID=2599616 RepID=UPI0011B4322B|nr:alpha/beta fold hydrolase [Reyranella sp. CPCC 100927]TWT08763.1 alpha/beta fold hydrolase [Reyranella sp. CPCC 100927]